MSAIASAEPRVDPPSGPDPPYTGAGTLARVECTTQVNTADVPAQNTVTTFFFQSTSSGPAPADWSALATFVSSNFYQGVAAGTRPWNLYAGRKGTIRIYNMADAKPRPEKAFLVYTPASYDNSSLCPRELALCLSYYGTRNLPRQRGRVYLGPFTATYSAERPTPALMQTCLQLGINIKGPFTAGAIGDWQHTVWSRQSAQEWPITNYWVNDVWDVHRERGQPETTRLHSP